MPRGREGQVKPWVTGADVLTALRIPLAVVFPFLRHPAGQLGAVAVAAASDFFDGILARRFGSSRVGAVLDPVADKLFMVAAFLTVARWGMLHPIEIAGVLTRDAVAVLGFAGTWLLRRPVALPARAGGQAGTGGQILTLLAALAGPAPGQPPPWGPPPLRLSAEIGILNGANTYTGSFEALYRFTDDKQAVVPYAGAGVALAGHAGCGTAPPCPALWVNAAVGLEVRSRSTFSWMVEYHAM